MRKLPQRLVNVRVGDREALDGAEAVWDAVEGESRQLDGRGRVLVRPSGTEPVVRVMVEAPDEAECDEVTSRLVQVVERVLKGDAAAGFQTPGRMYGPDFVLGPDVTRADA